MEMDLGSAIIGAVAIMICILPFIMMSNSRKKREKLFLQALSRIAAQNNCQIGYHEIFGNFAIGFDSSKNFVFFYKQTKDNKQEQSVDLEGIQNCKVINVSRTFKSKEESHQVIDRLELCFTPMLKNKSEIKLEFFNADLNLQLYDELKAIENWSKMIKDRLLLKK